MISLICSIQKNAINELMYRTEIESQTWKQTYGYQGISGEGINWEIGTDLYTLLHIKDN